MQTKSTQRAIGPNDRTSPGRSLRSEARIRPDHAAQHGRITPRDATARRGAALAKDTASMDYQQGFFSGPSS